MSHAAPDVRARERFVGRAQELRVLRNHLASAEAGRGRIVLIGGDAGIGKTRLVERLLGSVPKEHVLWGRCREAAGTPPFWPWRQVLATYAEGASDERLRADVAAGAEDALRLVPALRGRLDLTVRETRADDEQARFQLFEAVVDLLLRASSEQALAIVLDDLHWADSESLLLLRHLGAGIAAGRLIVFGTYREVEMRQASRVPRILGDLARVSQHISLRGLGEEDVAAFARGVVTDLSETAVGDLHRATEGNPFFVKQVVALLQRDGWRSGERLPVPAEVREAIRRRLEPLAPTARWLLAQAAVLGREFDLSVLARLAEIGEPETLELLADPIALGLASETGEGWKRLRFAHALVQDTLYDDLSSADRASLHGAAGDVLEELAAGWPEADLGEIAFHRFRAVGPESLAKAFTFSLRAAEQAFASLGYEEAAGHYERALGAQPSLGSGPHERLRLLIDFGRAQALAGDIDGCRASFLEAGQLARELGDAERLAAAAVAYGSAPLLQVVDPIRVELLEAARAALAPEDSTLRAEVTANLILANYYGAPLAERAALAREAIAMARRLGDPKTEATALRSHYYNLLGTRDAEARLAVLRETARAADHCGDHGVGCFARISAANDYLALADVANADRAIAIASETADRLRLPHWRWRATVQQAVHALLAGELAEAERGSERAVAMAGYGAQSSDANSIHALVRFHVRRAQGRLGEVEPMLAKLAKRTNSPLWRTLRALAQIETGHVEAARAVLAELAAHGFDDLRADWSRVPVLAFLAEVCGPDGPADTAARLAELLADEAPLIVTSPTAILGPRARFLGQLALARGAIGEAVASLDEALALSVRMRAPVEVVRAQLGSIRALTRRGGPGDPDRAATLLAEAIATARSFGLAGLERELAQIELPAGTSRPVAVAERASLRREGDEWMIECGSESTRLRDTKGVGYLARLLAEPGRDFPARELAAADADASSGDAEPDGAVRDRLRDRVRELREELAEVEEFNDLGRATGLREELEDLAEELAAGMGGAGRKAARPAADAGAAERARLNVTRAIQAVLRRVVADCPALGRRLQVSVRTGALCCYVPDPERPLVWDV